MALWTILAFNNVQWSRKKKQQTSASAADTETYDNDDATQNNFPIANVKIKSTLQPHLYTF